MLANQKPDKKASFVILNMCTHSYVLYVFYVSLSLGEECISCEGKWFTPSMFEKFGGKGHHKKWKGSIYYKSSNGLQQVKLLKLIQTTDEAAAAQLNFSDSPLNFSDSPTDATEHAVSPVVEEAGQTIDEAAGEAAQLNFSDSPAERQNPDASEETEKTGQMQLITFLENQFKTMNNTLTSIDLSLKKLMEKHLSINI
uniref:Zgc:171506 n=1 Tax=Sinocyclocheilus grahami TaxID=75366 RepID=A0A672RX77_SINGR